MDKNIPEWLKQEPIMKFSNFVSSWRLDEVDLCNVGEIADKYARTLCNYTHFPFHLVGDACGTVPNKLYFKTDKLPNEAGKDLLGPFLEALHQRGIRVVLYFNGHSLNSEYAKAHMMDWIQIKENGEPEMDVYKTGAGPCLNGPWRQWQKQVIEEAAAYPIDGVFLDGDIFFADTCYCKYCRELFRKRYGKDLPPKSDKKHPDWRLLREFQIDSMTEYVKELREALKAKRPEAILFCNAGLRGANWATGRQNRRLIDVQDVLLSEGGFIYGNLNLTPIWKTECEVKLCKTQSMGKPVLSGLALDHKGWNWYGLTPVEARMMLYGGLSAGACLSMASSSADRMTATIEIIEKEFSQPIYGFVRRHKDVLYPTENLADIALAWSNVNADYYDGSSIEFTDFTQEVKGKDVGDIGKEFNGFYDGFWRNHLTTDVIDEVSLRDLGFLERYRLLVLPNVACLSEKEAGVISEYVRKGGTLVATFETSLYNEYGKHLENFLLSDVFGVDFDGKVWGPMDWDYVECVGASAMDCFDKKWPYTPSPTYGAKVKSHGAKTLVGYLHRTASRYDKMSGLSPDGFLFKHAFGKGRAYYFAGTFGQSLWDFHFPEYLALLETLGRQASALNVYLENAPECIAVSLRRNSKNGKHLLFLINHNGSMNRPRQSVIPVHDIRVECGLFPDRVKSLVDGSTYEVKEVTPGHRGFTLPLLREWNVFTW